MNILKHVKIISMKRIGLYLAIGVIGLRILSTLAKFLAFHLFISAVIIISIVAILTIKRYIEQYNKKKLEE